MSVDKEKETLLLLILYWVCKKYLGQGEQSQPCHPPWDFPGFLGQTVLMAFLRLNRKSTLDA